MRNFTVRRAKARDSNELSRCIDAAYSIYSDSIVDLPDVSAGIADAIKRNRVWVAVAGQQIVGGMVLVVHVTHLVLENIAVHPECSGMGVGKALLEQAETDCVQFGLAEIRLSTHEDMPQNVAIYSRLGWIESGRSGSKVYMSKKV